jgi:hypothetical protein
MPLSLLAATMILVRALPLTATSLRSHESRS